MKLEAVLLYIVEIWRDVFYSGNISQGSEERTLSSKGKPLTAYREGFS